MSNVRSCFNLTVATAILAICLTQSSLTATFAEVELPQPVPGYMALSQPHSKEAQDELYKEMNHQLAVVPTELARMLAIALVEAEEGNLDRAIERARKAERLWPDELGPHRLLSRLYLMNRDGLQARLQAERALELAEQVKEPPETKISIIGLIISAWVESKQLDQAEKLSKKWVSKEPKIAQSWYLRGWVLSLNPLSPSEEAIGAYHKALELSPTLAYAHYNLGILLAKAGDNKAALAEFAAFLKNSPEDPKAPAVKELISQLATR